MQPGAAREPCGTLSVCLSVLAASLLAAMPAVVLAGPEEARASRHALLVIAGAPPAHSAGHDLTQARTIAGHFGVPEPQVTVLREQHANAEAIRRAASDLTQRLAPGDQVLLVFSGRGSQRADPARPGLCEETFIASDGIALGHAELAAHFLPVAERAEKTVAIFDACHSVQRAASGLDLRCVPPPEGMACAGGKVTRWVGFVNEMRKASVPASNIAALLAAESGAPAFGDAQRGGLLGAALRACRDGDADDADRSGRVSMKELADCARNRIEGWLPGDLAAPPQVQGNRHYAPFPARRVDIEPGAVFEDIYANRDGRREVVLQESATSGGRSFVLRASAVGYAYLFSADPGGGYRLLFPLPGERENRLRAGSSLTWPRNGAGVRLPAGSTVLAVVSDNERDLDDLAAATDANTRHAALLRFAAGAQRSREPACRAAGAQRNLSLARACSDAYGAALHVIDPNK